MKSDEHWTSHSVPGIRSQQTAVQSPLVVVNTARCLKAASLDVVGIDVEESDQSPSQVILQSSSPSSSSIEQTVVQPPSAMDISIRWSKAALDVTVDITVDVEVNVGVGVGVSVGVETMIVEKPPSQVTSHAVLPGGGRGPSSSLRNMLEQTAVQPLLVTVTSACRLAMTGLPFALVAWAVHTRLTRPKTTDLVTSILAMVMRLVDAEKNV